jgi:hypothetical protein
MSFWIQGWIEVARTPDLTETDAWFGVVNLSAIVDVADNDSEALFGLSKACVGSHKTVHSLAARRGIPPNPSASVRQEMEWIAAHEKQYGTGEIGGYTYAIWAEISHYKLVETPEDNQWKVPFELARILEQRFGAERVRFVVWFNW